MTLQLDYSNFDFAAIKAEMIEKLQQEGVFADFVFTGSNINTLLELIASVGDIFNFYLNMVANESFIQTAELYESVNKLAELVGYQPLGYVSSTTTLNLTSIVGEYTPIDGYKISIPKFTRFLSSEQTEAGEDIYFTNTKQFIYVIDTDTLTTPGVITFDIPLVQGNPLDLGSEVEYLGDADKFQSYIIPDNTIIEDEVIVTINDVEWTRVINMYRDVSSTSQVYNTRFNKDQKVEIRFGDGVFGAIPQLNETIKIRYISSLGSDGNIESGLLTSIVTDINEIDTSGISSILSDVTAKFTFNQAEEAAGGANPEGIEDIRKYAPSFFRTQNRVVTQQDYQDLLTTQFSNFLLKVKALRYEDIYTNTDKMEDRLSASQETALSDVLTGADIPYSVSEVQSVLQSPTQLDQTIFYNNIYLVIVPISGDTLSSSIRDLVDAYLEDYKMITINHVYLDPTYIDINSTITYTREVGAEKTSSEIEVSIRNVILEYFEKGNRELGELLIHSELVNSLHNLEGVSTVILDLIRDDAPGGTETNANIQLASLEFSKSNTITITPTT